MKKKYFINDIVKIGNGCDPEFDEKWKGKICMIIGIETKNDVGATIESPYFILKDSSGNTDGFWKEELIPIGLNSFGYYEEII